MKMSYDKEADVLYVEVERHDAPDCEYIEPVEGIVYRVAPSGKVVGITIIGLSERGAGNHQIQMPVELPAVGLRLLCV